MAVREERDLVRELARQVAQIAASPENREIEQRWRDVNALRRPDRPPVWCRPVGAWAELLPDSRLFCRDPWLAGIEREFRMALVKHEIGDDSPVEPFYPVEAVWRSDPPNVWGVDVHRRATRTPGGAWAYDSPLKTEADFARLRVPRFTYDAEATERALDRAHGLLGDIMPVRHVGTPPLGATLGTPAADLRGLAEMTMDMAADPARMHRLMAHVRDSTMAAMDSALEARVLTPNNSGPMICSDPVGPVGPDGRCGYESLWVMANSQEFGHVSPAMWEEFCLEYQRPIIERFGLCAYGCCEDLTHKVEGVLSIPNLRIFVCSGWTDLDRVVSAVGDQYVIMWRQRAAEVVMPEDVSSIKRHLDEGMRKLSGCHVQIVLRELQTLAGHPDRLHQWTRLAIEAAARHR